MVLGMYFSAQANLKTVSSSMLDQEAREFFNNTETMIGASWRKFLGLNQGKCGAIKIYEIRQKK
jgi:hypothetical protein